MSLHSKSMVKELSGTTGTGSYTLAGAVDGYRTFDDAYGDGGDVYVPYVARMGSVFEIGIGLLSDPTTLERTILLETFPSAIEDGPVDWASGTKVIYSALGGECGPQGRNNLAAATAPDSTKNFAHGYGVGSIWVAFLGSIIKVWMCVDDGVWQSLDQNSEVSDHDRSMATSLLPVNQDVRATGTTTNATPQVLAIQGSANSFITLENDSSTVVDAIVVARDAADNVSRSWRVTAMFSRNGSGTPALIGSVTKTDIASDGAASAWDIAPSVDSTDKSVQWTATGASGKTITWMVNCNMTRTK